MAKTKIRNRRNYIPEKGQINDNPSKTMPGMSVDPRTTLENHVRGINPITGAVLDRQLYYGDEILPYAKDLTYEELRMRREGLLAQANELNDQITALESQGSGENEQTGEGQPLPENGGEKQTPTE
jgi:hypothetical protein